MSSRRARYFSYSWTPSRSQVVWYFWVVFTSRPSARTRRESERQGSDTSEDWGSFSTSQPSGSLKAMSTCDT